MITKSNRGLINKDYSRESEKTIGVTCSCKLSTITITINRTLVIFYFSFCNLRFYRRIIRSARNKDLTNWTICHVRARFVIKYVPKTKRKKKFRSLQLVKLSRDLIKPNLPDIKKLFSLSPWEKKKKKKTYDFLLPKLSRFHNERDYTPPFLQKKIILTQCTVTKTPPRARSYLW